MRLSHVSPALIGITILGCGSPPPPVVTPVVAPVVNPDKPPVAAAAPMDPCLTSAQRELAKIKGYVTVRLYWSPGIENVERRVKQIERFFKPLYEPSDSRLTFEVYKVTEDSRLEEAKEAGLVAMDENGVFGIVFMYQDERETIPILPIDNGPGTSFWMINKIREVGLRGDGRKLRIGVLTGTDEISLSEKNLIARIPGKTQGASIQGIFEQALDRYQLIPVDLRGGQNAIDSSLAGLLVTQPGRTLTTEELKRIDEFLLQGGKSVAIMAGATNLKAADPKMIATLDPHGIDKLLAGYGIEMRNDVILDAQTTMIIPIKTATGKSFITFHGVLVLQYDPEVRPVASSIQADSIPFFHLSELAVPFASTLIPHADKQPGAKLRVLLQSSPQAQSTQVSPVNLKYDNRGLRPEGSAESRAMAVELTGTIQSAFGAEKSKGKGRLLVISSAQYLTNPFARAGNGPMGSNDPGDPDLLLLSGPYAQKNITSTILSLKNTFDWMTVDDDLYACSAHSLP